LTLQHIPNHFFNTIEGTAARSFVNQILSGLDNMYSSWRGTNPVTIKRRPEGSNAAALYSVPSAYYDKTTGRFIQPDDVGKVTIHAPNSVFSRIPEVNTEASLKHEILGHGRVYEGDIPFPLVRGFLDEAWFRPPTALQTPNNLREYLYTPIMKDGAKDLSGRDVFWQAWLNDNSGIPAITTASKINPSESIAYWLEWLGQARFNKRLPENKMQALIKLKAEKPDTFMLLRAMLDNVKPSSMQENYKTAGEDTLRYLDVK